MVARISMFLCLLAVVVYTGNSYLQVRRAEDVRSTTDDASVRAMGIVDFAPKHLAAPFKDTQGTLLADAPITSSQYVDPPALVIGHLESSDPDSPAISWPNFDQQMTKALGRPVSDLVVENGPSQIDKIKTGQITLMALHAADAPFLVNNCGFQPVAVMGTDAGASGNRLDLIVPANSTLASPSNLRGHTLTCTGPLSIVGYRAAIVLLLQNNQLRPNVDYFVSWSLGQKQSIKGVTDGSYEAAAVSDDKLHSMLDKGTVKTSDYKIIFQSDVFPRSTIGYFYNLKPALAARVRQAILSFKPDADDVGDQPMHFVPVDYKKDFALIRSIDDRFDPRLEPKSKAPAATTKPIIQ